jgi:hypothetical protein
VTHGFARYRLHVMPVIFLVAAWAWTVRRQPAVSTTRSRLAVALALALAVTLAPSFEKNLGHRAFGGTKYPRPSGPAGDS